MLKAKRNSFLKCFIGIVLLIIALCSFMATAFATNEPNVGAVVNESLNLNATVPASLPIHVGEDGKVTTASNASITNNGSKPIEVSSINITASSGWTVQSKVDATNAKAGSKVIAIGFNNSWATPNSGNASGSVNTSDFGKISASGTLNLVYDAVIPVAAAGGELRRNCRYCNHCCSVS